MKKIVLAAAAAAGLALTAAAPAFASDDLCKPMEGTAMTQDDVAAMLKSQGYEVRKMDTEDGCIEMKGMKDGKRVEVYVHPVSGEVVKIKNQD